MKVTGGGPMPAAESEDKMTIDLSTIARRIQPVAVLASVNQLLKQARERLPREPRRERRSMNG